MQRQLLLDVYKRQLYFNGEPVDYSRDGLLKLRQKVGIVFQDPDNQLFSASVYQEKMCIRDRPMTMHFFPFREKP